PWLRPLPPRSDPPRRPRALPSFPTRRSSDLTGGGAADILQAQSMAEVYRIGITRMLSTNAQLDVRPCTPSVFDSKFHQLAYADLVQAGEGVAVIDFLAFVLVVEQTHVVTAQTKCCLGQVVGAEAEELCLFGNFFRSDGGARHFDHGADEVFDLDAVLVHHFAGDA